jgi:hypothetical protein
MAAHIGCVPGKLKQHFGECTSGADETTLEEVMTLLNHQASRSSRRMNIRRGGLIAACAAALPAAAWGGTYTVTHTGDDGTGAIAGTLSWAVTQANADPGSTIDFTLAPNSTIFLGGALPQITVPVIIDGTAVSNLTLDAQGAHRAFFVNAPGDAVTIENLNIANGKTHGGNGGIGGGGGMGAGGGLFVGAGNVSLVHVAFIDSAAAGGNGGARSILDDAGGGGGGGLGGNGGAGGALSGGGGGGGGGYADNGADGVAATISGLGFVVGAGGNGGGYNGAGGGAGGNSTGSGGNGGPNGGGGGSGGDGDAGGDGGLYGGGGGGGNRAGVGGFGGGGGSTNIIIGGTGGTGGTGGFGGGGGNGHMGGYGGGAGTVDMNGGGGGGGAAFGGAVFVQQGATISFTNTSLDAGALRAGDGAGSAGDGLAAGSSLFLMGGNTTFNVTNGQTVAISGSIAEAPADTYGPSSLTIAGGTGGGTLFLKSANTYSGGTTITGNAVVSLNNDAALGAASSQVTVRDNAKLLVVGDIVTGRTFNLSGAGQLATDSGGSITYSAATVNGGYLGAGSHILGDGTSLNGTTLLAGAHATQSGGTVTMNIATLRGSFIQTGGALSDNNGFITSSGAMTIGGTLNTSGVESDGVLTLNPGGMINNSGTNLTLGGGSRTYIGSAANSGGIINLNNATAIDLNGGLLVNNGTIYGPLNVNYGATARGAGAYGAVNIAEGGTFHPGNSPGIANTGDTTWQSGGTYQFDINDAIGSAGTNWSFWNIDGTLTIEADQAHPFILNVDSVIGNTDTPGDIADFNKMENYSWLIAQAGDSIIGFDSSKFNIDAAGFTNPTQGVFSISQSGDGLYLRYTAVPEPAALGLLSIAGLLVCRRRRES